MALNFKNMLVKEVFKINMKICYDISMTFVVVSDWPAHVCGSKIDGPSCIPFLFMKGVQLGLSSHMAILKAQPI